VALLLVLAVIGGSAEHAAGAYHLRRGPASVVLSVLITLAGFAGVASVVLLFWGLVTRKTRSLESSAKRRRSPILVSGAVVALFACLAALLALAARKGPLKTVIGGGGNVGAHGHTSGNPIPFNLPASMATVAVVGGIIAAVVLLNLVRSLGWRRAFRRLHALRGAEDLEADQAASEGGRLEALSRELGELSLADPLREPDPRRAVIECYLQMLEIGARHGPERRRSETPTEYLRRMLSTIGAAAAPAATLTGLFETARYSERAVSEPMRSEAIAALDALRDDLLAGAAS